MLAKRVRVYAMGGSFRKYAGGMVLVFFGQSKTARAKREIEQEADKQIKIEVIKAGRK